jgi:hypothetical protein
MKRILLAVTVALLLGSCSALSSLTTPNPNQNVDVAGTSAAILKIAVAQTLTAQPTSTSVPPSATTSAELFATPVSPATDTSLPTDSPVPNLTTTVASPTSGADSLTATPALAAGQATPTWTLAVRTYGTLPPLVPFGHIALINKAKAEAYISLHVDLDGSNTVIEYPVRGTKLIQAPLGFYQYVAWVGGREMVGEFSLHKDENLEIILYRDKIVVR